MSDQSEPTETVPELGSDALLAKIEEQERLLDLYREMVGRMALAKDKNEFWLLMRQWWNGQKTIGHDLKTPEEQKAFLFG